MIIAIIYIFLSYMISDQPLKVTFSKSSAPPEKNHSPFLLTPQLKSASPPLLPALRIFQLPPPPLSFKGGGEDTVSAVYHRK